ncbi:MAG TPA: hypothetical protein PLP17_12965, partial [Oligoflexia bacterium]|nr:hypothetical protein [Oligoflexia bacterium]
NPVWLPSRWAADILGYYVTGQSANAGLEITLLWSCAFGSLALGYLAFDYFLLPVRSLAGMHHRPNENGMMKRRKRDIFRTLFEFVYHRVPLDEQFRAIILKDLTSVVRDRAQALQLLIYLGIAVVALVILEFMSSALNLSFIGQRSWWAFLASCNVLFTGFVITALMTRLVYPSISLEGKAFWIMITAPIDMERLIKAKFLCWLPFIMFIASVLLVSGVVAIYATWELMLASVLVGLCLSIGCTGLAVGIGSIFASFEWESPTQIATGFGTLVLLLASLALVVIIFMPASTLMFMCTILEPRAVVGEMLAPFGKAMMVLLIFLINFLVASFSCRKGVESLSLRRA